jgi:hypothetical protein
MKATIHGFDPLPDDGPMVPRRVTIEVVDDPTIPYDVTMVAELQGDRLVCTTLTAKQRPGGEEVTATGLRRIPTATLIRNAVLPLAMKRAGRDRDYVAFEGPLMVGGDDELESIAAVYRIAHACGERPTAVLAEVLDASWSTAAKKVKAARDAGLLGPAVRGKATV